VALDESRWIRGSVRTRRGNVEQTPSLYLQVSDLVLSYLYVLY
jgi:hypothetical protein